ncbi:diacylglycerol kinase family protein [Thermoanaerobacterium saccharolyticum]|uniref:diacylglycerol/lipid kinase family protein n=1 Tax=Thermoanaerobacterium saccharolyticum TaxID=28896 RepID=UPI0005EDC626
MIAFIVNPTAGNGKAYRMIPKIEKYMKDKNIKYKFFITNYPGHGTILAREAAKDSFDIVVAVGGDGTVHEVINGIGDSNVSLGIIPLGTGNDFARYFRIPKNVYRALEILLTKKTKLIDSAVINKYITCNNVANIGIDADVAVQVTKFKRFVSGILAYTLSLINVLFKYKPYNVKIDIDGKMIKRRIMLAAFGNCSFYGGGFKILPDANPDDGYLDVIIVNEISKFKLLFLLPMAIFGKHTSLKCVETYKAEKIHIDAEEELALCVDGEVILSNPIVLNVKKNSVKICTN